MGAKPDQAQTGKDGGGKRKTLPLSGPCTPQDIIDQARQYGPACLEALAEVMANGTDASRVSAAGALLDRAFGKVGQPLELTGKDGEAVKLDVPTPAVEQALQILQRVGK